jgi:hypothetical protein
MKRIFLLSLCSLAFAGCHRSTEKTESAKELPSFKEGKGLSLPAETSKFIGLQTIEVSERSLTPQVTTEVQVYRTSAGAAYASGFISAEHADELKAGDPATLSAKNSLPLTGKITRVEDPAKTATGQAEVLIEIPTGDRTLQTGTSFTATFASAKSETVIVIPRAALLRAAEGDFVFVVNGEHFLRTPVKVGMERDDAVEITDGLYAGDKVAVQPVQSLWLTELRFVKGGAGCCAP